MTIAKEPEDYQYWKRVAQAQYTRALEIDTAVGNLHYQVATTKPSNYASQFFHHIKSLVVSKASSIQRPIVTAMIEFLGLDRRSATQQKEPLSSDQREFFIPVAHLVLASLEPSQSEHLTAFESGFKDIFSSNNDEQRAIREADQSSIDIHPPAAYVAETDFAAGKRAYNNVSPNELDVVPSCDQVKKLSDERSLDTSAPDYTLQPR